jgi:multicomponent Na+:H+ antiporter subunit E
MRYKLILFLTLLAFWLLNSGHYTPLLLSLGLASVAFVLFLTHKMDLVDHYPHTRPFSLRYSRYLLWLIKELVLANIAVVKSIWLGNQTISPTLSIIPISQKTDIGKVIYATSITFTPGTVTVDLSGNHLLVHALFQKNIAHLIAGEMDRRITELERS